MAPARMHADEVAIDAALVQRLLTGQFPRWAHLPRRRVRSSGTDHAIFRLGTALCVRLPRIARVTAQVEKEQRWLPLLAPHLPLAIPTPVARGGPDAGYPFAWSVYTWLAGAPATLDALAGSEQAARELAAFVVALRQIDPAGAPSPGAHNFGRGVPLAARDTATREAIGRCGAMIDGAAALAAWQAALAAPAYSGAPLWIHGDLQSGNLLVRRGRLRAVIDFGGLAAGDPACDLLPAWNLFDAPARRAFRAALAVDEATWARGRGWALSVALLQLPHYHSTNPALAASARHTIAAVLAGPDG